MSPKNIENLRQDENVNVIDVASEPVEEKTADTSKNLGDTSVSKKEFPAGKYAEQRGAEVREKISQGKELSGADRVVAKKLGIELPNIAAGKPEKEEEKKPQKLKGIKELTLEFLDEYRDENKNRKGLSENRREKLDQALESLDKPEGLRLGEKIIGTIIRERAEDLERFPNLSWADADKRIMGYISGIISEAKDPRGIETFLKDNRISDFENYLNIAKDRITDNAKRQRIIKLAEQIDKFKKGAEIPPVAEAKPKKKVNPESPKVSQPEVLRLTDEREKEKTVPEATETENKEAKEDVLVKNIESLFNVKKDVEKKLSHAEDESEARELEIKNQIFSEQIIETAAKLPEFRDIKKDLEQEKEREWEKGIVTSGYKTMDNYKKWHEGLYYNEVIKNSSLSPEQKQKLFKDGEIAVGNWFDSITLNKDYVAIALKAGLDITELKHTKWWNPFSDELQVGNKIFGTREELNKYLSDLKTKEIDQEVQKRINLRKQEIIEKSSVPIINNRISKIMEFFSSKEKKETQPTPLLPVEAKLDFLNGIRSCWKKAEIIDDAIKTGKDLKMGKWGVLNSKTQQKKIEGHKEFLSDSIILIVEKLTGRKLKKEALDATGYKLDKDIEKQKEYRSWLTNEVEKVYKEQIEDIKKQTGKKIKIVQEKNKLLKTNERKFRSGIKKDAKIKPLINRENIEEEQAK